MVKGCIFSNWSSHGNGYNFRFAGRSLNACFNRSDPPGRQLNVCFGTLSTQWRMPKLAVLPELTDFSRTWNQSRDPSNWCVTAWRFIDMGMRTLTLYLAGISLCSILKRNQMHFKCILIASACLYDLNIWI